MLGNNSYVVLENQDWRTGIRHATGFRKGCRPMPSRAIAPMGGEEEKYRSLFDNALEGVFQTTEDGQFVIANPACARILGYGSPEEFTGRNNKSLGQFFADPAQFRNLKGVLAKTGVVPKFEAEIVRRDEKRIWISFNLLAVLKPGGVPLYYQGRMEDISDQKKAKERSHYLSFHDSLTGLYNRAYFEEEVKRLDTDRQLPISVIFGDVNSLKLVNDAFGHDEGDKRLQEIAFILRQSCRKEDVIARLGGDEFAVFLPRTSGNTANEIMERVKFLCRRKNRGPVNLSIALGACTKEDPSQDLHDIFRKADECMYRNKLSESKTLRNSSITSMRRILLAKSLESEGHFDRLNRMAVNIGRQKKISSREMDQLVLLASWHDVGNIALPKGILKKPGLLTREEWSEIRKHPEIGYRIAESCRELAPISEGILAHHERWDGTGYPLNRKQHDIPLISRIISIARCLRSNDPWQDL